VELFSNDPSFAMNCPTDASGASYSPVAYNGTQLITGTATAWSWRVEPSDPCEQVFLASAQPSSFTQSVANAPAFTFTPHLGGTYRVVLTVEDSFHFPHECEWQYHVVDPGVRVELCWANSDAADLDLHMHRPQNTGLWFGESDCHYANCGAGADIAWSYASSPGTACDGIPGADWSSLGYCPNPRLEQDNSHEAAKAEVIAVDNPNDADVFRVAVHNYEDDMIRGIAPIVVVYCGGVMKAVIDLDLGCPAAGCKLSERTLWRVANIATTSSSDSTDCTVDELHPPGMVSGSYLTGDDNLSY
jgi:hypothetical protein